MPTKPNAGRLAAARLVEREHASADSLRKSLQALPIDLRAKFIVEIFSVISAEFAAMVLEHVKPPKAAKRRRRAY